MKAIRKFSLLCIVVFMMISTYGCNSKNTKDAIKQEDGYEATRKDNERSDTQNKEQNTKKEELATDKEETKDDAEQSSKEEDKQSKISSSQSENDNDEKKEVYDNMLKRSLMSTGNNYRMKQVIKKAKQGEPVTIAYIGGSITEGAGANNTTECYAYQSYEYFKETYGKGDSSKISFVNAGMGGTPSALGIIRYDRDVTDYGKIQPDIVFIEFAVNDYQEPTNGEAYESMIRKVLSAKNQPAVVLVFSVFQTKWNMQDLYQPLGEYYALPMISVKDAVVPELNEGRMAEDLYFSDPYHPTTHGHTIMSDCIINYYKEIDSMEEEQEDHIMPVEAKIGSSYVDIQMIDSSYEGDEIKINVGSFSDKDLEIGRLRYSPQKQTFPNNWKYTKDATNVSRDDFSMELNCKNLLFVYKASSEDSYGTVDIYIDSNLVTSIQANQSGGWNNPVTVCLLNEEVAANHHVEIKMAKDNSEKEFTIMGFGYSK